MIKTRILLSVCLLLFGHVSFGQFVDGAVPSNNELDKGAPSASVGKIVNVDLYTGIGSVTIPIYEYSIQGIDMGISISYNNKGIMVGQTATSVGLGWNLNAGGQITRTVKNIEDEVNLLFKNEMGYGPDSVLYGGPIAMKQGETIRHADYAYDEHHIDMGGRQLDLAFTMKWRDQLYTYPKSEICFRYVTIHEGEPEMFDDFTAWKNFSPNGYTQSSHLTTGKLGMYMVDEKGHQYIFIPGDIERKYYEYKNSDTTPRHVVSRWVLWKFRSNNGNEVKFNYDKKFISYEAGRTETLKEYFRIPHYHFNFAPSTLPEVKIHNWSGTIAHLSSIEYPDGTRAIFHTDSSTNVRCDQRGNYVLDSITLESKYGNNLKNEITYRFNHAYFHTPTDNANTEIAHRTPCNNIESGIYQIQPQKYLSLKLKSIDRVVNHKALERYYTFDYHPTPLPVKNSIKKDFYNYYNNGYTTGDAVPLHVYDNNEGTVYSIGTDRTPDTTSNLTYIQACILKKITNELGGVIEINYEKPNIINPTCQNGLDYGENSAWCRIIDTANLMGQNATDGLVIKSLLFRDGVSPDHDKLVEYNYAQGQRFFRGGYFWYPLDVVQTASGIVVYGRMMTSNMYSRQILFRGSNHGFGDVTVVEKNRITGEQLSKSRYTYSNLIMPDSLTHIYTKAFSDTFYSFMDKYKYSLTRASGSNLHCRYSLFSMGEQPSHFHHYNMGLLLNSKEYNANNDVTSEEKFRYDLNFLIHVNDTVKPLIHGGAMPNSYKSYINDKVHSITANWDGKPMIPFASVRLREKTTINYSGSLAQTQMTQYKYDNYDNETAMIVSDSKGDTFITEKVYAYDIANATHLKQGMQYVMIERTYKPIPGMWPDTLVLKQTVLRPTNHDQKSVFPSKLSNEFSTPNRSYYIRALQFSAGDTLLVQGYTHKKELRKLRFASVYTSLAENPDNSMPYARAQELQALNNAVGLATLRRVKEYTLYDCKENVLEVRLDEQLRYNAFIWDSRNAKKIAEVTNANHNEIAYTSFEGLNQAAECTTDYGNWNFNTAGVVYSPEPSSYPKAITGKYIYNLNVGNITIGSLPTLRHYELSFWADIPPKVYIGSNLQTLQSKYIVNGWTLYTLKFVYTGGTITILDDYPPVNVGFIDELRIHPTKSSMTTYTYEPLFGVSSQCDNRNNITYTEYDEMGRPNVTRDRDGNIITQIEVKNQTVNQ